MRDEITINCSVHGNFTRTLASHVHKRSPTKCPSCKVSQKVFYTIDQIREIGNKVFGGLYTYPDQDPVGMKDSIRIVCNKHGEFTQVLRSHTKGFYCNKCSYELRAIKRSKPLELFIKQCDDLHKSQYDYSKFKYVNSRTKGLIICKRCQLEFSSKPQIHLTHGIGCPSCTEHNINYCNIYSKAYRQGLSKEDLSCSLYLVEFTSKSEYFIKVGITTNTLRQRFHKCSYNFKEILKINTNLEDALNQEKEILHTFKEFQYIPLQDFKGFTECFDVSVLNNIKNVLLARNGH